MLFRLDLWRERKEREFGRRREEATIGGGGCDENYPCRFGLVLERGHHSVGFCFISIICNKLCFLLSLFFNSVFCFFGF